jgi:hypothetical protein
VRHRHFLNSGTSKSSYVVRILQDKKTPKLGMVRFAIQISERD